MNSMMFGDAAILEAMKYVMKCQQCQNISFTLMPDGHVQCGECGLTYSYIQALQNWVFTTREPEEYIKMKYGKIWDNDSKEFRPIREVMNKSKIEGKNQLSEAEIEKMIDAAELKLISEGKLEKHNIKTTSQPTPVKKKKGKRNDK